MSTMQQEFDAVVTHLFKQGRPAKAADGHTCLYRGPNGTSCAVGCRIPDSVYTPEMDYDDYADGTGVYDLLGRFGDILPPEITMYDSMFARLQTVHDDAITLGDGSFNRERLAGDLERVAKEFGLTFTVPA